MNFYRLFILGLVLISTSCVKNEKNIILDIPIQRSFSVNAGLSPIISHFYSFENVSTNIDFLLNQQGLDPESILEITPVSCRLQAQFAEGDFNFIEEVSIFIASSADPDVQYEVFYRDPVPDDSGISLDLIPTLANAKEVMTESRIDITVVLRELRSTPPNNFDVNLNLIFGVVE